jgi:glycosyltransferase involved in cell wall biosynthesis
LPRVTIAVPCFNHGRFLDEAVDSILAQTYQDLEIVVVDDGSTDPETKALLDRYDRPKTRVLREKNGGPSAARNRAIEAGSGEYVMPLDADDRIAPTYVEKAVRLLDEDPRLGIVYCLAEYFGERTGPSEYVPFEMSRMLRENMISNTAMFRRSDWAAVGGYCEAMRIGWEDWEFWLSLVERGCGVHRIPETMYGYRILTGSRNQDLHTQRSRTDAMFRVIIGRHTELYAAHAASVFKERGFLDRREGLAARIGLAALARPWRGERGRVKGGLGLLAWVAATPLRRVF